MNPENPTPVVVFHNTSLTFLRAIDRHFKEGDKLPGLILFYTSLDVFSAITRPINQADTSGEIFKKWIDSYMLPFPPLRCSSMDLWGARCGLLHTYTTESKKSREGQARELGYIDDDAAADELQKADAGCVKHVVIGIPSLMRAYISALRNFTAQLQIDAELRARAEHHLKSFILAEGMTAEELEAFKKKFQ